jgi:hypothetical protein
MLFMSSELVYSLSIGSRLVDENTVLNTLGSNKEG